MLVLNRKIGEEIKIGNDIVIRVISTSEGGVKIGIDAPQNVPILRGELYKNVKQNVIEATQQSNIGVDNTKTLKINKLRTMENDG